VSPRVELTICLADAQETERLLAENQGMAARAGAFVLHEAQDRPELAQKVVART
jgi:hypothetical protein